MPMKYLVFVFSISLFLFVVPSAHAADFSIECGDTQCVPESIGPFFDSSFLWYPSATQTRSIQIKNTSSSSQYIGHQIGAITTSPGANIAQVLTLDVRRQSDMAIVWTGTVWDLYAGTEKKLDFVAPGISETYRYTITMQNVGNEFQGKSVQISLDFGYIIPTPTPIPTRTPTPTITPSPTPTPKKGKPTPTLIPSITETPTRSPTPTPTKKKNKNSQSVQTPTDEPAVLGAADSASVVASPDIAAIKASGVELGVQDNEMENFIQKVIRVSEELVLTLYEVIMQFLQGMVQTT